MNLHDAVIVITGGRRVGASLARQLIAHGSRLALIYNTSKDVAEALVEEARTHGRQAMAVPANLADSHQAARAIDAIAQQMGRIDGLVNMASVYRRTPFENLSPRDYDDLIASNLTAPYNAAVCTGKAMLLQPPGPRGLRGKIINVGDWATDRPGRGYLPYLVAKGALKTFTMALARELAPSILVNLVQPGTVEPPDDLTDSDRQKIQQASLLGQIGQPSDLVELLLYLLASADFATGSSFRIDGGRFLGSPEQ